MSGTYKVSPGLRALLVPIATVRPHPDNVRVHGGRDVELLMALLDKFGMYHALQATLDGVIYIGNGRLMAAERLGWTHVPVERHGECPTCEGRGTDCRECGGTGQLTEATVLRLALADNRSAELSEWRLQELGAHLERLEAVGIDLAAVGWEPDERTMMAPRDWLPKAREDAAWTERHLTILRFDRDQWVVVQRALAKIQAQEGEDVEVARALELICADYLGGAAHG